MSKKYTNYTHKKSMDLEDLLNEFDIEALLLELTTPGLEEFDLSWPDIDSTLQQVNVIDIDKLLRDLEVLY